MIWRTTLVLLALTACGPAPQSPEKADPPVHPSPGAARLDAYLEGVEALGFSGAVIVEEAGSVALREAYGLADREARRPYTPDTVQTHGSITKQMTAAAILLLESRGLLSTDDPLARHFENVPEDKAGITLHHLLTHTSGLPGGIGPDAEPIGSDEYLERALSTPLQSAPGTEYDYSNAGYSLLGILVERISGRGYEEFLREELLLPAGLTDTGYLLPGWSEDRLAVGYEEGERWGRIYQRQWREDGPGWNLRANGGLHTTVDDMHRWLSVLEGEGPLSPDIVEKWTTGYVDEGGGDSRYGYGWAVEESDLGPIVAHNGGNGVFSADFVWLPEAELFVYIQGNSSIVYAANLRDPLLGALLEEDFAVPPAVEVDGEIPASAVAALAGTYAGVDSLIPLTSDDVRLITVPAGQAALDAFFATEQAAGERLGRLSEQAATAIERLQAGREDAFEGLVGADEDAAARARSMLDAIADGGELESVTLIGSVENAPGGRFAEYGPWTTFFRAEHGGESWIWSVLWREDGTYRGTAIGPPSDAPRFVLVPAGDGRFTAVEHEPPWRQTSVAFDADGCLEVDELRACR